MKLKSLLSRNFLIFFLIANIYIILSYPTFLLLLFIKKLLLTQLFFIPNLFTFMIITAICHLSLWEKMITGFTATPIRQKNNPQASCIFIT